MKRLMILFVLLSGHVVLAQRFPVSVFKMYQDDSTYPSHAEQLQRTFPLLEDAAFTYGLPFTGNRTTQQILELLDSANAHNVKIILPRARSTSFSLTNYASIERFYFDPTYDNGHYFATVQGQTFPNDPDVEQLQELSPYYDRNSLRATEPNEYVVRDARYQPILITNRTYRAVFRLKVQRPQSGGEIENIPVVDIEVRDLTDPSRDSVRTLYITDFPQSETYYRFSIDFNSLSRVCEFVQSSVEDDMPLDQEVRTCPHVFDFRVKWHGTFPTWLDNIRVDGGGEFNDGPWRADSLFSGRYNADIQNIAQFYNVKPALARFYLRDEPNFNQYLAYGFVNQLLRAVSPDPSQGKGLGHTAQMEFQFLYGTGDPYVRYAREARPYELAANIYRIHYWNPLPTAHYGYYTQMTQFGDAPNRGFQTAIEKFRLAQQNSSFSESGTWWYYPNIGLWAPNDDELYSREPYLSEIRAQVHLALAYGAKGVFYFHYWTRPYDSLNNRGIIGLIQGPNAPDYLGPITSSSPVSLYGEDKWDGIKQINQKLAGPFGSTLMRLRWLRGYSVHQGQPPSTEVINNLTTSDPSNETYIELGIFEDSLNINYAMVVNRRTAPCHETTPCDRRDITMQLGHTFSHWLVTDVDSGQAWVVPSGGFLTISFEPGEGKLFKLVNVVPSAVRAGWNTLSVPSVVRDFAKTAVWPTAISCAYAYVPNFGYQFRDTLANGPGYWIKFASDQTVLYGGFPISRLTIPVQTGWNLVGSITYPVLASRVCSDPPHIIISPFWGYAPGYSRADTLKPGGGYWVKVSQNGSIILDRNAIACDETGPNIAGMDKFTITDAEGNQQELFVANADRDPVAAVIDGEMPPPPPEAEFDARFEAGEILKAVDPEQGSVELNILFQTMSPPIRLSWEINPDNGITYSLPDSGGGLGKRTTISGTGSLTLSGRSGVIRLNAEASSSKEPAPLPSEFALAQNHPNPFNPRTVIDYQLPVDAHVVLKVYDLLGRVVATLVDEQKPAGYHRATFDAAAVSSGVYFYRMAAGSYNAVRKLLVVK